MLEELKLKDECSRKCKKIRVPRGVTRIKYSRMQEH